jgi:hypothetical protein
MFMVKSFFHALFIGLILSQHKSAAQAISLHLTPHFKGNKSLASIPINGDSLSIHTLRFYLSNIRFLKNGKTTWAEPQSHHLLDTEQPGSMSLLLKPQQTLDFDAISFDLGVDSLTNVSGAMGGDLDPTKGMYWAWNSGYINFKIEGFSKKCPARNHEFQFHIGGYMPPFNTLQTVVLNAKNNHDLQVEMDLTPFFENMDFGKTYSIMSPSAESVALAKLLSKTFRIHGQ